MNKNQNNIILPLSLAIYVIILFLFCKIANVGIAYNETKSIDYNFFLEVKNQFPKKNQYAIFKKDNQFYDKKWIKLIIAGQGDIIKNINNNIIINDHILKVKDKSLSGSTLTPIVSDQEEIAIKEDQYFIFAPHEFSLDSRYEEVGIIDKSHIIGRAIALTTKIYLIFYLISTLILFLIFSLLKRLINKKKAGSSFLLLLAAFLLINLPNISHSKDLGIHGKIYEIQEKNILLDIKDKLKSAKESGKLEELQNSWKEKTIKGIKRPKSYIDLPRAKEDNIFFYDPSITVNRDISDHNGVVFAKKGVKINPLKHKSFGRNLIFINGDDIDQVEYAVSLHNIAIQEKSSIPMIILTKGNIFDLMKKYNIRFFFDQKAYLSKSFNLRFLPSIVSQNGDKMQINEIGL